MKKILFISFLVGMSIGHLFAQDSNQVNEKKYATLGEDDQTVNGANGANSNVVPPSLRVVPFQWVDLRDPDKKAKTFQPTVQIGADGADEGVQTVGMDMTFEYFGEKITSLSIVTNGFVALGTQNPATLIGPSSWSPGGIPSPRAPNDIVAPMWTDIDFTNGAGYIFYRTFKPEKSDRKYDHMVVQWDEAGLFNDWDTSEGRTSLTFQVILFAEGGIMFQYKTISAENLRKYAQQYLTTTFPDFNTEEVNDYEIIKKLITVTSVGYEDAEGLKGIAWTSTLKSGMSLANELVPDWASGSNGSNFLDFIDGRDRRNNLPTSSGGGCFIAKKKSATER